MHIAATLLTLIFMGAVWGISPEFFFRDGEKKNFSMGFRTGLRGAGHPPEGCKCVRDPVVPDEVVCVCRGLSVREIPANMTKGVTRLSLESVSLTILRAGSLQVYKDSLRDLVFDRVKELIEIKDGAFNELRYLRTISIKQALKLRHINDGVFNCHLPNLKIVRVIQSGLEVVPNLQFLDTKSIIYMVDLDSNKIKHLPTGSVKMKTEMLNLDFNLISKIESKAFFGSEIAKLSLKGNTHLRYIEDEAFLGLKNIRTLDLSEASISILPTKGLEELEVLKLSEVYPLKVFPSVYHFKYIKEAYLTYPYHCCAFKFPATHDPEEFSKHVAFRENVQKMYCNQNPTTTLPTVPQQKELHKNMILPDMGWGAPIPTQPPDETMTEGNSVFPRGHRKRHLNSHYGFQEKQYNKHDFPSSYQEKQYNKHNFPSSYQEKQYNKHRFPSSYQEKQYNKHNFPSSYQEKQYNKHDFPSSYQEKQYNKRGKRLHKREWGGIPKSQNAIYQDYWFNMTDTEDFFGNHLQLKRRKPIASIDNPFEGTFHGTTVAVISEFELEAFCGQLSKNYRDVECFPSPDAFNPCEDVMGNMLLRIVVWIVVITSLTGNVAVMVVLLSTGACNSVSKFLMCNLAFADFCMGVYLLMIAAMDLHSIGTYFNYAIDWQHGYGCKVAGFLTVFATELSIYTLTVISVERWYAITYAINLDKRLKLRRAANIMSCGWLFALTMAFIPLINVNGFSRTSICLPMHNQKTRDVVYLMVLLFTNTLAFGFIFFCYGNMYMSVIRHQSRATANDMAVAKRMALLVITDFLCWSPVAFFAATAVSGYPLIDVTNSKILLVFFYPLNSCANPFLYAIFTTQYRRDFLGLLNRCDFCRQWLLGGRRGNKDPNCTVPPLQFSHHWRQQQNNTTSCSSQMSTDNSMRVLRPSDLGSQQDVFSSSGWEDQEVVEDVINLWSSVYQNRESTSSSEDSGQCCKNYSSSSHSTVTPHKGSPHPVKHRFIHLDIPAVLSPDSPLVHTTVI